jgi:hypothetical protein
VRLREQRRISVVGLTGAVEQLLAVAADALPAHDGPALVVLVERQLVLPVLRLRTRFRLERHADLDIGNPARRKAADRGDAATQRLHGLPKSAAADREISQKPEDIEKFDLPDAFGPTRNTRSRRSTSICAKFFQFRA